MRNGMTAWMAAAGFVFYLALNVLSEQPSAFFWQLTFGWLQPGIGQPLTDEQAANLPPAPLFREVQQHAAG